VAETKAEKSTAPARPAAKKSNPAPKPAQKKSTAEPSFDLSPDGIRDLLISRPEMIEEGLTLHSVDDGARHGAVLPLTKPT